MLKLYFRIVCTHNTISVITLNIVFVCSIYYTSIMTAIKCFVRLYTSGSAILWKKNTLASALPVKLRYFFWSTQHQQQIAPPLILKAKVRLRESGVKGLKRLVPVEGGDRAYLKSWFQIMKELVHVYIERWLFPEEEDIVKPASHFWKRLGGGTRNSIVCS